MLPLHDMGDSAETRSGRPPSLNLSEHAKGFNITSFTVQTPTSQQAPTSSARGPNPPRWKSPEFIIYGVLFLIVFPQMVVSPIRLSNGKSVDIFHEPYNIDVSVHTESHPNYYLFQTKLSKGWIFGRPVVSRTCLFASFHLTSTRTILMHNTGDSETIYPTYLVSLYYISHYRMPTHSSCLGSGLVLLGKETIIYIGSHLWLHSLLFSL